MMGNHLLVLLLGFLSDRQNNARYILPATKQVLANVNSPKLRMEAIVKKLKAHAEKTKAKNQAFSDSRSLRLFTNGFEAATSPHMINAEVRKKISLRDNMF